MSILRIGDGRMQTRPDDEIGAKAANLARMAALGLPVPPAFVVPIAVCAGAKETNGERRLAEALSEGITYLETATGKKFGDRRRPLLVSVRSGAAKSMPGMLDTVLNVGCTSAATRGLVRMTGNPGFAWDCRRRFLEGYAESVLDLDPGPLATATANIVEEAGVESERELDADDRERLAMAHEGAIARLNGELPDDAMTALVAAGLGVCRSWMSERARTYRKFRKLEHLQGTAYRCRRWCSEIADCLPVPASRSRATPRPAAASQ
jgi:pyruvate, orthophosphate dikinase